MLRPRFATFLLYIFLATRETFFLIVCLSDHFHPSTAYVRCCTSDALTFCFVVQSVSGVHAQIHLALRVAHLHIFIYACHRRRLPRVLRRLLRVPRRNLVEVGRDRWRRRQQRLRRLRECLLQCLLPCLLQAHKR